MMLIKAAEARAIARVKRETREQRERHAAEAQSDEETEVSTDENDSPLPVVKRAVILMEPSIPAPNPRAGGRFGGWMALQNHPPAAEAADHETVEAFLAELAAAEAGE